MGIQKLVKLIFAHVNTLLAKLKETVLIVFQLLLSLYCYLATLCSLFLQKQFWLFGAL